jgi:hypothetical protein
VDPSEPYVPPTLEQIDKAHQRHGLSVRMLGRNHHHHGHGHGHVQQRTFGGHNGDVIEGVLAYKCIYGFSRGEFDSRTEQRLPLMNGGGGGMGYVSSGNGNVGIGMGSGSGSLGSRKPGAVWECVVIT